MSFLELLGLAALAFCTCLLFLRLNSGKRKLPPGPCPLPIIGNLHQLGQLPHQTLAKLAQTYGPLMSIRYGSIFTVVVSSAEVAKEVFTKHDQVLSSRFVPMAARAHDHHEISIVMLPIGPVWRWIRKLGREHLFSALRLEASEELRQEKVRKLLEYVQECCDAGHSVNIGEAVSVTSLNLLLATLFSGEGLKYGSNAAEEFKSIIFGIFDVMEAPNVADFFPILQWMDPQGVKKWSEYEFGRMLSYLDDLVKKRVRLREKSEDSPKRTDFLETLLDLAQSSEFNYTNKDISHIFLELIMAGSLSVASVTEWAMTELLLNLEKLAKVKQELRTVIGFGKQVQESDFSRLPYFEAVMKESFRCHVPVPFLVARKAEEDVEIHGYTIPKGSQVLVNAWAIGKDPKKWSNPDSFEPERFLDGKIDVKGQNFDLIPFGAGRRICPGMPLANRMLPMVVASLLLNFDWKLVPTLKPGQAENAERFGLTLRKAEPLIATPIKIA